MILRATVCETAKHFGKLYLLLQATKTLFCQLLTQKQRSQLAIAFKLNENNTVLPTPELCVPCLFHSWKLFTPSFILPHSSTLRATVLPSNSLWSPGTWHRWWISASYSRDGINQKARTGGGEEAVSAVNWLPVPKELTSDQKGKSAYLREIVNLSCNFSRTLL